jgi:hypothetical protein
VFHDFPLKGKAMCWKRATCIALLAFAPGRDKALSQTPVIRWFALDGGFEITASAGSRVKSAVGQSFVGSMSQGGLRVSVGFLVDTLFRGTISGVNDLPTTPREFALRQNYPNPFNPTTTIRYSIPERTHVSLRLFNLLGQEVFALVDEDQESGEHSVQLNASPLASGVYFYSMTAGRFSEQRKLIVLK